MAKTKARIEAWALEVCDRSRAGERVEDDRVEVKAGWVDPSKVARRIAGIANAARMEPFLFMVGVEECVGPVDLPREPEFSEWWAQVASYFDPAPPRLEHLVVDGAHALYFEPDRPPYAVKVRQDPADTSGLWEVPWREGARTRSARHADLIRMLIPRARIPDFDIRKAVASTEQSPARVPALRVAVTLYIAPQSPERIVLPFHRSKLEVRWEGIEECVVLQGGLHPTGERKSKTVHCGSDEIVVDGPGQIWFSGSVKLAPEQVPAGKELEIRMHLDPLPESDHLVVETTVPYTSSKNGRHFWGAEPPADRPPTIRRYRTWRNSWVTGTKRWPVRGF